MNRKTALGWFLIVSGAWFLLTGVVGGDMGGIVHLGYNPDVPLSTRGPRAASSSASSSTAL